MTTPNFDGLAVGDELPTKVVQVRRGDLVNYAGVAADRNPIHWHDGVAAAAGFDSVIAHGMLTMAYGGAYLSGWMNDPSAVREYDVRFVSPVFVPVDTAAEIEFSGRIKSLDPQTRTGVVILTALSNGKKIFGKAVATVQFA